MAKRFITPFAEAGDRSAMPDAPVGTDSNYQTGYPSQYEEDPVVNPATAKFVERDKSNQLYNDITANIKEWQEHTYPAFITSVVNGGVPFSYKKNSIVTLSGVDYASSVDGNEDVPPSSKWEIYSSSLINDLSQTYTFPTVTAFKDSLIEFPDGKTVHLTDRGADFTKISGQSGDNTNEIPSNTVSQSLTLVLTESINSSALGVVDDALTDNAAKMALVDDFMSSLPVSVQGNPMYTLVLDVRDEGVIDISEEVFFSGSYHVIMNAAIRMVGARVTAQSVKIGAVSDSVRLSYEGLNLKLHVIASAVWTGLLDYNGVTLNNLFRSKIEIYNVSGFEVGVHYMGHNHGNTMNKTIIRELKDNRVHISGDSFSPLGDSSGYFTSNQFEIIGKVGNTSTTKAFPYDRIGFRIDGGSFTSESIHIHDGVVEGLAGDNNTAIVLEVIRGADITMKNHRDEANRLVDTDPICLVHRGSGITYEPIFITPAPGSKRDLISFINTGNVLGCKAGSPSIERVTGVQERYNSLMFDSGKLVEKASVWPISSNDNQVIPRFFRVTSSGAENKNLDLRPPTPLTSAGLFDGEYIKVMGGAAGLGIELDVDGVSRIAIEIDQLAEAPFELYYKPLDAAGVAITTPSDISNGDIGGIGLSNGSGPITGDAAFFSDIEAGDRDALVTRKTIGREFTISDRTKKLVLLFWASTPTVENPVVHSLIKSIKIYKVEGLGAGGSSGLSRNFNSYMTLQPEDTGFDVQGYTITNNSGSRTNRGWEYGPNGWESIAL